MERTVLKLEYEIRTRSGELLESSALRGPLEMVLGRRRLLPALERVIAGLRVGEEVRGVLEASSAFGDESVLPTMEIARAEFPAGQTPEPGRRYEARNADGGRVRFRVLSVSERAVEVRLLHPLADDDLGYRLKLVAVHDPSLPPPVPGHALGIESAAIQLLEEPPTDG